MLTDHLAVVVVVICFGVGLWAFPKAIEKEMRR